MVAQGALAPRLAARSPATDAFCARAGGRCRALFGSMPGRWASRLGRGELQQLHRCAIVKDERHPNSNRGLGRCDQDLPAFEGLVQIVNSKSDVRNASDDLGHTAMRLEPDPLDPVGTGLKTGDVHPEVRDVMLLSPRRRVWNSEVVVPPSELRRHGRQLVAQSLSTSHDSLHRSHSLIATLTLLQPDSRSWAAAAR